MRRTAQGMDVPIPEMRLTVEVFDKNGKRTYKLKRHTHSMVRNAYNLIASNIFMKDASDSTFGAGYINGKDTGGTIRYSTTRPFTIAENYDYDVAGKGYLAPVGADSYGIVIGTGSGAETFDDYDLDTQIADGTDTGQMSHVASELHSISYASLVLKDTLIRYFNNNSGGQITVNEIALYGAAYVGSEYNFMIARDKLGTGVDVADTAQLKVTYEISLTYPS